MKINIWFAIVFFGLFFGITAVMYFNGRKELESINFSGIIEKLSYDEKNIPDVTVKGITYNLTPLRKEFKEKVRVGDLIEKKKGISVYKVTKQQTGEIINFAF
ncbi:hypothetical protein [Pedobacter sp. GR22-10]|uniref:hypothetical protein n=1 Tax=Pedobacter sp. GR22-10 TaxID=2994472 RepID=UPI002246C90D|nr:hypothetical protein [Pedobacter sp. GR22-10]MCX2432340.1 hypothetical protein [Pedobacter sp. GR22-10]